MNLIGITIGFFALELLLQKPLLLNLIGWMVGVSSGAKSQGWGKYFIDDIPSIFEVFLQGEAGAIAFGEVVIYQRSSFSESLERHELTHARQARRYGSLLFPLMYVGAWLYYLARYRDTRKAYFHIPFEVEAYRNQYGDSWTPPK